MEAVLAAPGTPPAALAAAAPNELGLQLQAPAALHAALLRHASHSQCVSDWCMGKEGLLLCSCIAKGTVQ